MDFILPPTPDNNADWGPPTDVDVADFGPLGIDFNLAYEHLDKYGAQQERGFKLGKICDFTLQGLKYAELRMAKGKSKGKGKNSQLLQPDKDEEGFALVDNKPLPGKSFGKGRGPFGRGGKGRGKVRDSNYQEGILGQKQKAQAPNSKGKGKGRGNFQQRRAAPSSREWSVHTQPEWEMKREITLSELGKIQIDAREVKTEDLIWCGELRSYNKDFDKITTRTEKTIKRYENLDFFNPSTSQDPKLTDLLLTDEEVTVIATDHVLACLVAAARSQYSWDLIIQTSTHDGRKVMIIDKRDNSTVDLLTVNETATNNQNTDDSEKKEINSIKSLCQEATCINQNFSQFVLGGPSEDMDEPNPFAEEGAGEVASGAIRYRKFILPGNSKESSEFKQNPIVVGVRTEVNCKMPGVEGQYASVKALNEYDPKPNYSWKKLLQAQHGMVMATELKNNAYKIGRWTAEAILAGCDVMKIGYATRMNPNDPWSHSVLSVQTVMTNNFADQIGMHRNNVFGIIRTIVDLVMEWDDGKYLILKDPMKPILRMYEVPWSFGEEDDMDDDDVEEDEGPELDEEGNPTPMQAVGPHLA